MNVILAPEDGDPLARWSQVIDAIVRDRNVSRSAAIDIAQRDPEARGWLQLSKARTFIPVLAIVVPADRIHNVLAQGETALANNRS
jgi:hypothetical protein